MATVGTSATVYSVDDYQLPGNTTSIVYPGTYTVTSTYDGKTDSATLTVVVGDVNRLVVLVSNAATVGAPFQIAVFAVDSVGNTVTGFTGPVSLSASQGTIAPASAGTFSDGIWYGYANVTEAGSIVVTASDGNGHTGKSIAINVTSPAPTSTPSPTPTPTSAVQATLSNGATINLPIEGNITTTQISNTTITTNQTAHTTTVSFTVTGQSGTTGFCNITIPKTQVPYGTTPAVTVDGQQAQNQGFSRGQPKLLRLDHSCISARIRWKSCSQKT